MDEELANSLFAAHIKEYIWRVAPNANGVREMPFRDRGEELLLALQQLPKPREPVWEATDLFCPHCGAKGLLVEEGEGDYYVGPKHRCDACAQTCYIP